MAILRGAEARQWLAQNPNKAYTNLTSGESIPRQRGGLEKFFTNLTKPIRTFLPAVQESAYTLQDLLSAGRGDWRTAERPDRYLGMTEEESTAFREDPLKQGLKAGVALGAYGVPVGGGQAATSLGRIGTAAGRGAISGTMSGFGYSGEGEELSGTLTGGALGGLIGGATQGIGEASRAIQAKQQAAGRVVDTMNVDEIATLPKKTRSGLSKQAKSAGFWDPTLSESKNIQNYLTNRGFAGNTPAETLENLTQEFNRASKLKQEGLEEVGGLSRDYLRQARENLDEAIRYKGIGLDSEATRVYNDIVKTLEKGPQGAKELDNIIMKWNEAGRLAKGAQKTSTAGLYADAARELRNVMRSTSPTYDSALQALNQILGIEDVGTVAGAAKTAAGAGLNVPLFSGAGFRGADIKTPFVGDTISKTQAAIGRAQEAGTGLGANMLQGAARVAEPVSRVAQQRGVVPSIVGAAQSLPGRQPEAPQEGLGSMLPPQEQGPQIDQMALIEAVLNGQISTSEADWLMEMLGGGAGGQAMPKTDSGRKAMVARDAALQALNILEQDPSAAGKLQGIENVFYDITGQANTATEYKTQIEGLRSQVFNALGGTALSPTEKAQYEKFLPKQNDSPAQAKQKLQILIPMMEALMGAEVDTQPQDGSALYQMLYGAQ
jgi:hypothetical protein